MTHKKNDKIKDEHAADQEMDHSGSPGSGEEVKESPKAKKKKKAKAEDTGELKEQQEKYNALNDKYTRLFADFENYRKRTGKEKIELIKTASREVIEDLLPVLDDFDRALQALRDQQADEQIVQGIELIYNKLFNTLKQKGLEPMDSMGKEFNIDFHEAVTQIPAQSDDMKGKVFDVITKGYLLNGTIIRHAKVVVGV